MHKDLLINLFKKCLNKKGTVVSVSKIDNKGVEDGRNRGREIKCERELSIKIY
jgi:hypothetical protein